MPNLSQAWNRMVDWLMRLPQIWNNIKAWLREFFVVWTKTASGALALWGGIAGAASAYLSISHPDAYARGLAEGAVRGSIILFGIHIALISCYSVARVFMRKSTQTVPFAHNTYLRIISGSGYIENLMDVHRDFGERYKNAVCACGLNIQGSLSFLTEGSVVRDLMNRIVVQTSGKSLANVEGMTSEELAKEHAIQELQKLLDAEIEQTLSKRHASDRGLEYGDCLLVKYDEDALRDPVSGEASKDRSEDFPRAFRILFVINCSKDSGAAAHDMDAITGPASSSLMRCVFERLRREYLDLLFLPVLGTNRLGNSHQTVIASIVQQYSSHIPISRRYFDLMISVRKESMEWDALSLVRLRRYIREALRFYE